MQCVDSKIDKHCQHFGCPARDTIHAEGVNKPRPDKSPSGLNSLNIDSISLERAKQKGLKRVCRTMIMKSWHLILLDAYNPLLCVMWLTKLVNSHTRRMLRPCPSIEWVKQETQLVIRGSQMVNREPRSGASESQQSKLVGREVWGLMGTSAEYPRHVSLAWSATFIAVYNHS